MRRALGAARLVVAVEDHGAGSQLVRARWWPIVSMTALAATIGFAALSLAAELDGGWSVGAIFGTAAVWLVLRTGHQCGAAAAAIDRTVQERG